MSNQDRTKFDIAEQKERAILTKLFAQVGITDYYLTEAGSYKRYDFEFVKDGKTYIGDIKCRNIKSSTYKDSLINKGKIDFLVQEAYANNKVPLIIAAYTDDVVCTWSLFKELQSMKSTTRQCGRTTSGTTAHQLEKVENPVIMLQIANASKTILKQD